MKLRVMILLVTLTGNILLAAFLCRSHNSFLPSPTHSDQTKEVSNASSAGPREEKSESDASTALVVAETLTQRGFNWSQLESDDYKKYIAALRAFGVPEKIIRDIIIADVNKLYRPKFAALRPPKKSEKEKNEKFWARNRWWGGPDRDMTKDQREQMRALQKEKDALIKELLGNNVFQEVAKDSGYPDWTERQFGKLTDEQRQKAQEMQERFGEAQSEIYRKTEGYSDQDTQADLKKLRKALHEELA